MPLTSADASNPFGLDAISYLLAALGLSSTAGLRAYLPLLALGIASDVNSASGQPLIPLQQNFEFLGSPIAIGILLLLTLLEIGADKIPVLDHVNDAVHTIIRPAAGALIMAGTQNSLSDASTVVAAVVGAVLALATHGVKAGTRAAVTTTTAGTANPIVSLLEDVLSIVVILLLVLAPVIGFIALVGLLILMWRLLSAIVSRARRMFGGGSQPAASMPPPPYDSGTYPPAAPPVVDTHMPAYPSSTQVWLGSPDYNTGDPATGTQSYSGYYPQDATTIQRPATSSGNPPVWPMPPEA
jgi:hypothetical protein